MKIFVFITVLFGVITSALGQDVQDYQYVKVPEKFDFLKEENQYQLNALTAFLFDKKGYEVNFRENIPAGIDPCEVLQADVHSSSGLFRSRLYFSLKNCKNETVFTSDTGVSREKDFKTSYHEALRNAFESLEEFDPSKKEILIDPNVSSDEIEALEEQQREIFADSAVKEQETEPEKASSAEKVAMETASEGKKFTNGPLSYVLKPTSNGFELFKEGDREKFATLLKSGGGNNFLYASKNISGNAFFDTSGNLVVEYLDPNSQQLVTVVYKLQAQ
jgi:hypothetical protein